MRALSRALSLKSLQDEMACRRQSMRSLRHLAEYVHSNNNQYATLPSSSCTSRTISEAAPALHADVDAYTLMLAPCDESTVESAQADEPSGEVGMPPAVQSQNHQTTVQSSSAEDAGELKLSVSAEAQKDADRVQFSGEPYSQGESTLNKLNLAFQSVWRVLLK